MRNYDDDLQKSNELLNSEEVKKIYEKKFGSKLINRKIIKNRNSQKKGYDAELEFEDGRRIFIEEKTRPDPDKFYPDLLVEIEHKNDFHRLGWLYLSNAEVLAYFQRKPDLKLQLTLWKLKELVEWCKSEEFFQLFNNNKITEIWSKSTNKYGKYWKTKNYAIPFTILRSKNLNYRANINNYIPLDFYDET